MNKDYFLPYIALVVFLIVCFSFFVPKFANSNRLEKGADGKDSRDLDLLKLELVGDSIDINYRYEGDDRRTNPDKGFLIQHFQNGMFRLFEDGKVTYGVYYFEGDPELGDKFSGYYMTIPSKYADDVVIYMNIDYDNDDGVFRKDERIFNRSKTVREGMFNFITPK